MGDEISKIRFDERPEHTIRIPLVAATTSDLLPGQIVTWNPARPSAYYRRAWCDFGEELESAVGLAANRIIEIASRSKTLPSMKECIQQAAAAEGISPEDLCTFLLAMGIEAASE